MILNENSSMRDMMGYMNNQNLINERTQLLTENTITNVTSTLKNAFNDAKSKIGGISTADLSRESFDKAKDGIGRVYGFTKEQWDDEANQAKLKEIGGDIHKSANEIRKGLAEFATNPEKLRNAARGLSVAKFLPILGIVYVLACGDGADPTMLDNGITAGAEVIDGITGWASEAMNNFSGGDMEGTNLGQLNFFGKMLGRLEDATHWVALGIVLWLMEIAMKILAGLTSFGQLVKGAASFIFKIVRGIFSALFKLIVFVIKKSMGGKKNTGNAPNNESSNTHESYNPFENSIQLI